MPDQMTELDVARAIRDGDLASPQRFGNFWLYALRITGTGKAERRALGETVYRDPDIFLTEEFLDRCGGLPVIIQHPPDKVLDSKEFAKRIVGTIMLPYIKGTEVWGVARIYDADAAAAMENYQLSTSPSVILTKGTRRELDNGKHLLIEGEPYLLDHVAIVESGVWDKGGRAGPGIERNDAMPENEGVALDKLLSGLADKMDDCLKKMDSISDNHEKLAARMDELERDNDRRDRDRDRDDRRDDRRRGDRSDRRARHDEDDPRDRRDPRAPGEPKPLIAGDCDDTDPTYREKITDAQMKADAAFIANGYGGAPKPMAGESVNEFRLRLMRGLQKLSARYKDADLKLIGDPRALSEIETQIFADAEKAALDPTVIGPHLHQVTRRDPAGHTINEWYGDPSAWLSMFSGRRQMVTAIMTKADPSALTRRLA